MRPMRRLALAMLVTVSACADQTAAEEGPSGAMCPNSTSLTYASFAKPFFDSYCVRCHGGDEPAAGLNFTTEAGVRPHLAEIDIQAAKGPLFSNAGMPLDGAQPSDAEREMLGQFIACEK